MKIQPLLAAGAVVLALVALTAISGFGQGDLYFVRDSAFGVRTRPAVPFAHDEHNANAQLDDCTLCHHVIIDGVKSEFESSENMECSECHMAGGNNRMDLMNAYHRNCKGCHEEEKAGPVTCGECHAGGFGAAS
jgi:hypothetical protein